MVHLTKAFILTTILFAPALAAPLQFSQDEINLMVREPGFFSFVKKSVGGIVKGVSSAIKRAAPVINTVRGVVRQVAPIAAMVPGPIGAVGMVASAVARRDVEEALYARAFQDELDARGYNIQLDTREPEGLEARDLSEALEVRDNIYTLRARAFIDSIEMEARSELSGDLEARQFAEPSIDELD
jgi:hypothetical protein